MPVRRAAALLAFAALIGGACAGDDDGGGAVASTTSSTRSEVQVTTTTTEPPPTTTTVALPEPVPIAWAPCGGGFDCATVAVPVDYLDPGAGTFDLALTRRPAGDPEARLGSLLVNPGGPGASGVRRVQRGFRVSDEVAARFDIVGFDPRGVGASTPVACGGSVTAFRATDLAPDDPTEEAALEAAARAVAEECIASEGDRLANLGTIDVAHDVEVIRRALGEDQISFVGLSYGTLIAQLWADAYPTSVRAMVLDGVVDPAGGGITGSSDQAEAVADVTEAIDAACAADPGCAVADAGGVLAAYDALAERIEAGEGADQGVGPTQLAYALVFATYGQEHWPALQEALADGLDGDLRGVAGLAGRFTGLVSYAPFAIVTCLDGTHPTGYAAWVEAADGYVDPSARLDRVIANELLPCAFWPQGRRQPAPVEAIGAGPVLVVGSTGDAATPYEQAERVAERLRSGILLTAELDGHVALGASQCVADAATRLLVDLVAPAPGTRC